jgi:hypothetical protein
MSGGGNVSTLKSVMQPRVNVGITANQWGARHANHYSALCGASWPDLQADVLGRPVTQNTLDMRGGGAECNAYMPYSQSLSDHITRENLERPYLQILPEGGRGAADLMGKGRDVIPEDMYGDGLRGAFVRYNAPGLRLPQYKYKDDYPPIPRRFQSTVWPNSNDTTSNYIYRG